MQRIPFYSLEDLERGKREMEAFKKEREKVIRAVYCPNCKKRLFPFDTYHECKRYL